VSADQHGEGRAQAHPTATSTQLHAVCKRSSSFSNQQFAFSNSHLNILPTRIPPPLVGLHSLRELVPPYGYLEPVPCGLPAHFLI
jgi:hypothetical protein